MDFDERMNFYISCAVSAKNTYGTHRRVFISEAMVSNGIARSADDARERIAMRAARFHIARKGQERRDFVAEARRDFHAVDARSYRPT